MTIEYHDLDLGPPLRESLMSVPEITQLIEEWKGEPGIFTYRPVPQDAPERIIIIEEATSITDQDGLSSDRPVVRQDIRFEGRKGEPGTAADDTPKITMAALLARDHFHRQKFSVRPEGFSVIDVRAGGPVPGPTDDDKQVSRILSLTVRLRRDRPNDD